MHTVVVIWKCVYIALCFQNPVLQLVIASHGSILDHFIAFQFKAQHFFEDTMILETIKLCKFHMLPVSLASLISCVMSTGFFLFCIWMELSSTGHL